MRWRTTCLQVVPAFLDGDLEQAEARANQALELGLSSGQPDALSYYGAQLVTIRGLQGRTGELEDLIRQQAEANPGIFCPTTYPMANATANSSTTIKKPLSSCLLPTTSSNSPVSLFLMF